MSRENPIGQTTRDTHKIKAIGDVHISETADGPTFGRQENLKLSVDKSGNTFWASVENNDAANIRRKNATSRNVLVEGV